MRVLVIGSGGREHAIVWALAQSASVTDLWCAPGNAGTGALATNSPISVDDHDALVRFAQSQQIDLAVVGPEAPLAAGMADRLRAVDIPVVGGSAAATRIESSKAWSKQLMVAAGIPTARAEVVHDLDQARAALRHFDFPLVIKADGLAAGKGVVIAQTPTEAESALTALLKDGQLGAAGSTVVIEEFLEGPELSVMAFSDGQRVLLLPPARDYKRAFDGDHGPNTGGMGAYSPPPDATTDLLQTVKSTILNPAVQVLSERNIPLQGILYAGLILTANGPYVLEFNARLGDPEAQVILPRLTADFATLCYATATATLDRLTISPPKNDVAVGVVLASGGYPGPYQTNLPITGLDQIPPDTLIFHAGTKLTTDGQTLTAGGRVLTIVGQGPDLPTARQRAYEAAAKIHFLHKHHRTDIAVSVPSS